MAEDSSPDCDPPAPQQPAPPGPPTPQHPGSPKSPDPQHPASPGPPAPQQPAPPEPPDPQHPASPGPPSPQHPASLGPPAPQQPAPPNPPAPQQPDPPGPPAPQQLAPPVAHPLPPPARPQLYLPRAVRRSSERDRDTVLHTACSVGAYHEVVMLLLGGHPTNPRNVWEETPLHHCAARGHLDVMMALLDSSADVNAGDHQGLTPLHQAIIYGKRDAAELLLCYGASVHGVEGVKNRSPLELAQHVHVCRDVVDSALGKVWSLQHVCRIAIRQCLGVGRRRRVKELPLPPHLLSFLCCLPVAQSDLLHANWERRKSSKSEMVRRQGKERRRGGRAGQPPASGLHLLRQLSPNTGPPG